MTNQATKQIQLDPFTVFAEQLLKGARQPPEVGIGPVVWDIAPGADTKHWYFVAYSIDTKNKPRIDRFKINDDDRLFAQQARATVIADLISRQKPILLMDFDDELDLAKWAEALCPGSKASRIRRNLERERA